MDIMSSSGFLQTDYDGIEIDDNDDPTLPITTAIPTPEVEV